MPATHHDPNKPARRDELKGEGAIRGTSRMEAFADGVFAIAFTLPIFQIVLPVARQPANLGHELLAIWPSYVGYILASIVIGLYWVHHHFSGAIYRVTGHWFLVATAVFLAMIGFIAFPARILAESLPFPAAMPAATLYWVGSLAATSLSWLVKWTVGRLRGQVDSRLEPAYIARLDRHYKLLFAANLATIPLALWSWQAGLALSTLLMLWLVIPPETPRYIDKAPVVEGEESL